jgi:hypothetical protein
MKKLHSFGLWIRRVDIDADVEPRLEEVFEGPLVGERVFGLETDNDFVCDRLADFRLGLRKFPSRVRSNVRSGAIVPYISRKK